MSNEQTVGELKLNQIERALHILRDQEKRNLVNKNVLLNTRDELMGKTRPVNSDTIKAAILTDIQHEFERAPSDGDESDYWDYMRDALLNVIYNNT